MADGAIQRSDGLQAAVPTFNWVFLVELAVAGILTVFFLFYSDRLFAAIISYSIRPYVWKKYKVLVSIESLQISLLGGRVFAKGIRYHGKNETIYVQHGHITWQYWLWSVRQVDLERPVASSDSEHGRASGSRARSIGKAEAGNVPKTRKKPCRVYISVQGLEWFVYNRSPAYDEVATQFGHHAAKGGSKPVQSESSSTAVGPTTSERQSVIGEDQDQVGLKRRKPVGGSKFIEASSVNSDPSIAAEAQSSDFFMLKVIPVEVECHVGAVILGSPNTSCMLVANFRRAEGEIDADRPRSVADLYKQLFNFDFIDLKVVFQGNPDYSEPQLDAYPRYLRRIRELGSGERSSRGSFFSRVSKLVSRIVRRGPIPPHHDYPESSIIPPPSASEPDESSRDPAEYAKVSNLVESPRISLSFFWDTPGTVNASMAESSSPASSPEWGINLTIRGGSVNYGPWADRQRVILQSMFVPRLDQDQQPAKRLSVGERRRYEDFKVLIEIEETVTLRVPMKESSKDATWRKRSRLSNQDALRSPGRKRNKKVKLKSDPLKHGSGVRPYGWIDITVAANSTIRYDMAMIAQDSGYKNQLDLDLRNIEVLTSVNHQLMLRIKRLLLSSDLSNPLEWNALHSWTFSFEPYDLQLFLLRDHVFLVTNLINDWGSGPPADYFTFTPFVYTISLAIHNPSLLLNVNDGNIIDNPTSMDDNTFLRFESASLNVLVGISLRFIRPDQNEVTFSVDGEDAAMHLDTPSWKTQHQYMDEKQLAKLSSVKLDGRYHYFTTTEPSLADTLILEIDANILTLVLYGALIKYFVRLKENYLGEVIHFKTFEEYQLLQESPADDNQASADPPPNARSNELDVLLSIAAKELTILLPSQIYTAGRAVTLQTPELDLDLRFTSYYMDLYLDLVPMQISYTTDFDITDTTTRHSDGLPLVLDGLKVYGHRLFGLPPTEPTYVCHWDFGVGYLQGQCDVGFVHALMGTARSFVYGFKDAENLLPHAPDPIVHDVTFLRASVAGCDIVLVHDHSMLSAHIGLITISSNDWAGKNVSERQRVSIADATIDCTYNVDDRSAAHDTGISKGESCGSIRTSCEIWRVEHGDWHQQKRMAQQKHVFESDSRTNRMGEILLGSSGDIDFENEDMPSSFPPAMCSPGIPSVLDPQTGSENTSQRSAKASLPSLSDLPPLRSLETGGDRHRSHRALKTLISSSDVNFGDANAAFPPRRAQTKHRTSSLSEAPALTRHRSQDSRSKRISFLTDSGFLFSRAHLPPEHVCNDSSLTLPVVKKPAVGANAALEDRTFEENTSYQGLMIMLQKTSRVHVTPALTHALTPILISIHEESSPSEEPRTDEIILDDLQTAVVAEAQRLVREPALKPSCFEVFLSIPSIEVSASSEVQDPETSNSSTCQSKIELVGLTTRLRTRTRDRKDSANPVEQPAKTVHLSIKGLKLLTTISSLVTRGAKVADVELSDLLIWLMSGEVFSGHIRLGVCNIQLYKRMLSTVVNHVDGLTATQKEPILALNEAAGVRERYKRGLIKRIAMRKTDLHHAEPMLLNRTAFMVRFSHTHVRAMEAWRIAVHLRHLLHVVQHERIDSSDPTESGMQDGGDNSPGDFDLPQLKQLLGRPAGFDPGDEVMQHALGITQKTESSKTPAIEMQILLDSFRISVGPGPNGSDIALLALQIQLSTDVSKPIHIPDVGRTRIESAQAIVLEVACDMVSGKLTWEICEILEELQPLMSNREPTPKEQTSSVLGENQSKLTRAPIQAILSVNLIVCSLDSINVKLGMQTNAFRASLNVEESPTGITSVIPVALILTAESTAVKLAGDSRPLAVLNLRKPSMHATSPGLETGLNPDPLWSLYGHCKKIDFNLKEEILNLLLQADQLLIDEVAQLYRLAQLGGKSEKPPSSPVKDAPATDTIHRARLMLRLDSYEIGLILLPSIAYKATGRGMRLSATSDSKLKNASVDFDARNQLHEILMSQSGGLKVISAFDLPPVNGRVGIQISEKAQIFKPRLSVDPVQIDLSSVQNLLHVINRPEILDVLDQAQQGIDNIISHSSQIFASRNEDEQNQKRSQPALALRYDGQFALAGFAVFAEAAEARLLINLGFVAAHLSNPPEQSTGPAGLIPNVYLDVRRMVVDLSHAEHEGYASCGRIIVDAQARLLSRFSDQSGLSRSLAVTNRAFDVQIMAETASTVVDIMNHLQDRIQNLDLSREKEYIHKFREKRNKSSAGIENPQQTDLKAALIHGTTYEFEMRGTRIAWLVSRDENVQSETGDLVLSIRNINLKKETGNIARLRISEMLLELIRSNEGPSARALNSALLPEIVFSIAYKEAELARRLGVQASGKSLDLRLTTFFIQPAQKLEQSIATASQNLRDAAAKWRTTPTESGAERPSLLSGKRLASLLIDVSFAGAVVYLLGQPGGPASRNQSIDLRGGMVPQHGRFGQVSTEDSNNSTTLRSPGAAFKVEYNDDGKSDPGLNAEIKIHASSNILYPTVVPLILEITNSLKQTLQTDRDQLPKKPQQTKKPEKDGEKGEQKDFQSTANAILGRTRLDIGFRICEQKFTLSCQPLARVAASVQFEDVYTTLTTVDAPNEGRFLALCTVLKSFEVAVQHVYSREPTAAFGIDRLTLSGLNSKHLSGVTGVSAILQAGTMAAAINARQLQDLFVFKEIWLPKEIRDLSSSKAQPADEMEPQVYFAERYQQVANAGAFPWNAAISFTSTSLEVDLGQSLGKLGVSVEDLWLSSQKDSSWEQNLCIGLSKMNIVATGRINGEASYEDLRIRTSIHWPAEKEGTSRVPLIEASAKFEKLTAKVGFDYQVFAVGDLGPFSFLMYNVRGTPGAKGDRLVATLDGSSVQAFCSTMSAARAVSLQQALTRFYQEKIAAYESALKDIDKYLNRLAKASRKGEEQQPESPTESRPVRQKYMRLQALENIQTDITVNLGAACFAAFPNDFADSRVFKVEALRTTAHFAVSYQDSQLHSALGMTLGRLQIALNSIKNAVNPKASDNVDVQTLIDAIASSKGGTILKVPQVVAEMQTWQGSGDTSNQIEYTFSSAFNGKVDVGWNYSRISFIRGMWAAHTRNLSQRLGKALPQQSAVQITGGPKPDIHAIGDEPTTTTGSSSSPSHRSADEEKITAVINMPESKYEYHARTPAIIDTPQLRDMGEATPPLEWIGLHRDKLPNLTHQLIIVALQEVTKEVEDA